MKNEDLAIKYYPYVKVAARIRSGKAAMNGVHLEREDLEGFGIIGLLKACETFNGDRSKEWMYFHTKIRFAISDGLRHSIGRAYRRMEGRVTRGKAGKRTLDDGSLPLLFSMTIEKRFSNSDSRKIVNEASRKIAPIGRPTWDLVRLVISCMRVLNDRERLILCMHYGADMTFARIGALLGFSESAAYQKSVVAREKIRYALRSHGVTRYEDIA